MFIVHPPIWFTKVFPNLIWHIPVYEKILFLTFDDGPIRETTPWLLDLLEAYDAKATFFCVGENVKKNPDLFYRIKKNKHAVGNHTYHHLNGWNTANYDYIADVEKADALIQSDLFRPPYGRLRQISKEVIRSKYKIVMWDVLSRDYDNRINSEECLQNVLKNAVAGSIIVFHDSLKAKNHLQYVLPKVLEHYKNLGFKFKPIKPDYLRAYKNTNYMMSRIPTIARFKKMLIKRK